MHILIDDSVAERRLRPYSGLPQIARRTRKLTAAWRTPDYKFHYLSSGDAGRWMRHNPLLHVLAAPRPYRDMEPAVITIHDVRPVVMGITDHSSTFVRDILRFILERSEVVLHFLSEACQEEFVGVCDVSPERCVVGRPWLEVVGQKLQSASSYGRPYVLCIGSTHPHKRFDTLFHAFALSPDLSREMDIVVLGAGGTASRSLQEQAAVVAHSGVRIHFVGQANDNAKSVWMRNAACVVSTSTHEGLGLVPIEAALASLPLAATSISAHIEAVFPLPGNFVPGDIAGCARAVREALAESPHQRRQRQLRVAARYGFASAVRGLNAVYNRAQLLQARSA